MIERTVARFALEPNYLAAEVAYDTGEMLGWLVGRGIDPHILVGAAVPRYAQVTQAGARHYCLRPKVGSGKWFAEAPCDEDPEDRRA